ncbi:uncharacterized protein LOC114128746 isoform X1 [Aphis gossypii]|uniref:uncharacterized protein LOC114128746 isoform X1 n=1 Tax=Aphis gossypii TaxID=80765 RepID=UPI00215980CC|nr:uncharacterized protein LOC114128746 isoform X1 [Aphis gossypii]
MKCERSIFLASYSFNFFGKIFFYPCGIDMLVLDDLHWRSRYWRNQYTLSPSIKRSGGIDEIMVITYTLQSTMSDKVHIKYDMVSRVRKEWPRFSFELCNGPEFENVIGKEGETLKHIKHLSGVSDIITDGSIPECILITGEPIKISKATEVIGQKVEEVAHYTWRILINTSNTYKEIQPLLQSQQL